MSPNRITDTPAVISPPPRLIIRLATDPRQPVHLAPEVSHRPRPAPLPLAGPARPADRRGARRLRPGPMISALLRFHRLPVRRMAPRGTHTRGAALNRPPRPF